MKTHQRGFTLVELAIVLVIIGLIVGGVLVGRDLIRNAELRSVTSDFLKFETAMNTFQAKYNGIAGHFTRATEFFGKDNAVCPGDSGAASVPGTCNGTGGSYFEDWGEALLFWQHLGRAGLIKGVYDGKKPSPDNYASYMDHYGPSGRISNSYYSFPFHLSDGAVMNPMTLTGIRPATITLGRMGKDISDGDPWVGGGGVLTHMDAHDIDEKIDDGIANDGKLNAAVADPTCNAEVDGTCWAYVLTNTTDFCMLSYQLYK